MSSQLDPLAAGVVETFTPEAGIEADGAARLVHVSDVLRAADPPEFLINGLVERGAVLMALGAAESAKSLWWQRAAACIATGTPMDGRTVKQGPVVYLAGEGRSGLQRRFRALEVDLGISLADAPLLICFECPSLCTPEGAERLRLALEAVAEKFGPPEAVIVDTMARHMAGGNENSAADTSAFFAHLKAAAPDAACVTVHHMGWGAQDRNRGSSAIRAAADQEMLFSKTGDHVRVEAGKQKDGQRPDPLHYQIRPVRTGLCRPDGSPLDSVTLEPIDTPPAAPRARQLGPNQAAALRILRQLVEADPFERTVVMESDWREAVRDEMPGVATSKRWPEVVSALTQRQLIRKTGHAIALADVDGAPEL